MADNITTAAEANLITTQQMARAREIDFAYRFNKNIIPSLLKALGVTRKIEKSDGTTLYAYKTVGELQDGNVAEGEVIPLSQYERKKIPIGELSFQKWRKATTLEAISRSGYAEAVRATDAKLISDIQKSIRTRFFESLMQADGTVFGEDNLQKTLATTWGRLQLLFEDDSAQSIVHFINPMTISNYLGTAQISLQTAFGFSYVENFLGLGTVIMTPQVPINKVYSTVKDNIVMYYVPISNDSMKAFNLYADNTGYIGIHVDDPNNTRAQIETLAVTAFGFFIEYIDGVVLGQIDGTPTLGVVNVASAEGSEIGKTAITMSGYTLGDGEKYVYKTSATDAIVVKYGQRLVGWTTITSGAEITATDGHKITVAAVAADGRVQAAGTATLDVKAS